MPNALSHGSDVIAGAGRTLRGVAHVHTTASYDGVLGVGEVAAVAERKGWDFVLLAEHSDGLTESAFTDLEAECRRVSHDGFLIFPSVEFTCEQNLHILGYGAGFQRHASAAAPAVARSIRDCGDLAILAHPRKYARRNPALLTPTLLETVSGVEVWNSKLAYDGPWIPPVRNYDFLYPGKLAFCGQDAHYYRHFSSLIIRMSVARLTREDVLAALNSGTYTIGNGPFTLPPVGVPTVGPRRTLARAADTAMMFGLKQALVVRDYLRSGA